MLVVLVVMGLLLATIVPGRLGADGPLQLRAAARAMVAGLERSRSLAVVTGAETVFAIDVKARRFQVPGDPAPATLPSEARLSVRTTRGDVVSDGVAGIRFFPDGGSTGGGLVLSAGEQAYRINVDWLTGRVEASDAP